MRFPMVPKRSQPRLTGSDSSATKFCPSKSSRVMSWVRNHPAARAATAMPRAPSTTAGSRPDQRVAARPAAMTAPATRAVTHTRPIVWTAVDSQPELVPATSNHSSVVPTASKAVPPTQTTTSASIPGGAGRRPADRREAMVADSAPNASPVRSQGRPHRSPPAMASAA
jgi:hypothetical protein